MHRVNFRDMGMNYEQVKVRLALKPVYMSNCVSFVELTNDAVFVILEEEYNLA